MSERGQHLERARRRGVRSELGRIAVLLLLVASVWVTSFQGRTDLVRAQQLGCERGKADRIANAAGWRTAQAARTATAVDPATSPEERASARRAANRYDATATSLERRARIDCETVFPDPGPFAFH